MCVHVLLGYLVLALTDQNTSGYSYTNLIDCCWCMQTQICAVASQISQSVVMVLDKWNFNCMVLIYIILP